MADAKVEVFTKLWGNVPDSHAKDRTRGQIRTPLGLATPIYCANCGKFAGYTYGDVSRMLYLCDNSCDKYGTGLDLPVVDEDVVRALNGG